MIRLESITADNFKPYGTVMEFPEDYSDTFYIVDTEEEQPWRVAVFRYDTKEIKIIENHPTSKETFEPLKGISVLLVAEHEKPEEYHAFILDKPVCLKKGTWHQVLALTDSAQVKITENLEVPSEFYEYESAKCVYMGDLGRSAEK